METLLKEIAIFLTAAVLIVPFFKQIGLGTVLGYLIAGIIIGPSILGLVTDVETILHFSEFGVVLLLFIIGLELQPSRLWVLRRSVFGLGAAQFFVSAIIITLLARTAGLDWIISIIIGLGGAMSSTAFVLQILAERNELSTRYGRDSFSILLFQDLIIIPILLIVPFLATDKTISDSTFDWLELASAVMIIVLLVGLGRQILRVLFKAVTTYGDQDIFTAAALLVVIAMSFLMSLAGLSMSLGAFLAGVLLADSEFRHQIEAEIEPFKGLLLGLFFIAVGMSVNLGLITQFPYLIFGLTLLLIVLKFIVLMLISVFRKSTPAALFNLSIALCTGGEFAFVLFNVADKSGVIGSQLAEMLIVIITLSMIALPVLFIINDKLIAPLLKRREEPDYDRIDEPANPVIIIGFGRFGQITARLLRLHDIHFTAIDNSASQIDFVRKFGNKVYYGDATRLQLLRAAKINQAKLVLLAIGNTETSLRIANLLIKHFPNTPIYARARNRFHVYKLMDLNISVFYRDTYYSSLYMAKEVLMGLGISDKEAERTIEIFKEHDKDLIKQQYAIHHDESALIQNAKEAAEELKTIFESEK